jgi:hypothetical protein
MRKRIHVKYPLFMSDFNENWILWTDTRKKDQKSDLIKIRPIGAEQFNADGRIEEWKNMTKVIVAFRNSANPTKNLLKIIIERDISDVLGRWGRSPFQQIWTIGSLSYVVLLHD